MIKIVTREHWRELVDERNTATNNLTETIKKLRRAENLIENYEETIKELGFKCEELADKLDNKNAEIKKLKALLTKNKIDYKHLYKGGK